MAACGATGVCTFEGAADGCRPLTPLRDLPAGAARIELDVRDSSSPWIASIAAMAVLGLIITIVLSPGSSAPRDVHTSMVDPCRSETSGGWKTRLTRFPPVAGDGWKNDTMKLEVSRTPDCASWMEQVRHNVARGDTHAKLFRQGVLQVMKWYDSALVSYGVDVARAQYNREPGTTGSLGVDAAFAALAHWQATRDGWAAATPSWIRRTIAPDPWYASDDAYSQERARSTCPALWREHNVWIGDRDLLRPQDWRPEDGRSA